MNLSEDDLASLIHSEWDLVRRCRLLVEDSRRCIGQTKALCTLSRGRVLQSKESLPLVSSGGSEGAECSP